MKRMLSTGVLVEVEAAATDEITLRLVHPDHTVEWIVSPAEAEALMAGLDETLR